MATLKKLTLSGFRSVKSAEIEFRPLNVLIGANGAGKSNLIAFFKMLSELSVGHLQTFLGDTGRASGNLHFGPKATSQLSAELDFEAEGQEFKYRLALSFAAGDSLYFSEEFAAARSQGQDRGRFVEFGAGYVESRLGEKAASGSEVAGRVLCLLNGCRVYHFHDTTATARVRQYCYVEDSLHLAHDAANLAARLYELHSNHESVYRRIVSTIRLVAPYFDDFELHPTGSASRDIILNWRHRKSDLVFGPHQLSDGTLRAICLISLLLQPVDNLPYLIVVDEPELGLHPYALNVIASLFHEVSHHTQVLVSTQSSAFLDSFNSEDILIVERDRETTTFKRPDVEQLESWLEDYSLGEIWEKNVIGGGPH